MGDNTPLEEIEEQSDLSQSPQSPSSIIDEDDSIGRNSERYDIAIEALQAELLKFEEDRDELHQSYN